MASPRRDVSSATTIFTRRRHFGIVVAGICFLVVGVLWTPAFRTAAANGPAPPQSQQLSGVVGVQVDSGQALFVDPLWNDGGKGQCRIVANKTSLPLAVPLGNRAEWQSFRDPLPWPAGPHAGASAPNHFEDASATQTVCCRPQTVTLCAIASAATQTKALPYAAYAQSQTVSATCTDQWGAAYTDSQTWQCGQTGSGTDADGQWNPGGPDNYGCSPNAFTSACTATCSGSITTAVGTTTTYDSCGNVQSVNSCSKSCCTTNYQASAGACSGACGGGHGTQTVTMTDYGTCHGGSYSYSQNCVNNSSCGHYAYSSCSPIQCPVGSGYACDCPFLGGDRNSPAPNGDDPATKWYPTSMPGCAFVRSVSGVNNKTGAGCSPPSNEAGGNADCWATENEWYCTN